MKFVSGTRYTGFSLLGADVGFLTPCKNKRPANFEALAISGVHLNGYIRSFSIYSLSALLFGFSILILCPVC